MSDDKPSFETLTDALSFIERCLSNGDQDGLFGACVEDRESDYMRPLVFEDLLTIHVKRRLRSLYLHCFPPVAFPTDADEFKLGGHESELGHIHIDFKRDGQLWQLASIWKCR